MLKRLFIIFQQIIPQHGLSTLVGKLADSRLKWLKCLFISTFTKLYAVNMSEAQVEDPHAYPSFNDFFIRALKSGLRPTGNGIACPADGTVAEAGSIHQSQLMQAKNSYFDLNSLLGGDQETANQFIDGQFVTIYLAPHNYHRVHMPLAGRLVKTIYIPGKLFSVNRITTDLIPNLYSRNERLVCLFETETGPMAVILVGALIVGSMQTTWMQKPIRAHQILKESLNISFNKGDELGYFKLGSTVLVLFGKDAMTWNPDLSAGNNVQVGQNIGKLLTDKGVLS